MTASEGRQSATGPGMPCVVLVGAPGSGKSTVGRRGASAIGTRYLDTDEIVARTAGMTVADIFVTAGEPAFRKMEEEAVQEALQASGSVVSLGGGAIISEVARQRLSGHRVVWLRVSVADAALVDVLNARDDLLKEPASFCFLELLPFNDILEQLTS